MGVFREFVKAAPLGLALPVTIGAASVGPDDAISNLGKWIQWLGITDLPPWLRQVGADRTIVAWALGLSVCYALLMWGAPLYRRLRASRSASDGIRLVFGTGEPFDQFRDRIHLRDHTIRVRVENASSSKALTNCELLLSAITGTLAQRCPVKIKENFSLNPGGFEYVPIASFSEAKSHAPVISYGGPELHFQINPLSDGKSYMEDSTPHDLTLVATAAESRSHTRRCKIWVEGNRLLKLDPL